MFKYINQCYESKSKSFTNQFVLSVTYWTPAFRTSHYMGRLFQQNEGIMVTPKRIGYWRRIRILSVRQITLSYWKAEVFGSCMD